VDLDWNNLYAARMARVTASEIRELLKLLERAEIISFAGGIPDTNLFPYDRIERAHERLFADKARRAQAFQYGISEGYRPLRQWIARHLGQHGAAVHADDILITNGSQQGIEFVAKLLISEGDKVIVTRPSYLGALQAFSAYGPDYVSVPIDEDGICLEPLEAALRQGAKLLYLVPDYGNPTGVTLSEERRPAVVELAARYGVPILEDAAYTHLCYDGDPLSPLLSYASPIKGGTPGEASVSGNVIYAGTFSKSMVPGLRVGWLVAPRAAMQKLVLVKQASDLCASQYAQMVLHDVVQDVFDEQADRLCDAYRERRDAMLEAIRRHFPQSIRWTEPKGGMFVWLELPEGLDGAEVLRRAIEEVQVAFVPGAAFFADRSGANTCRLSFSAVQPDRIREGVARLGNLFRRMTEELG
jgi:DNA-binding transcriptional MocR family regulator